MRLGFYPSHPGRWGGHSCLREDSDIQVASHRQECVRHKNGLSLTYDSGTPITRFHARTSARHFACEIRAVYLS